MRMNFERPVRGRKERERGKDEEKNGGADHADSSSGAPQLATSIRP